MTERELDEVLCTLLDLYTLASDYAVSPQQFAKMLHESVDIACEIADSDELLTLH